MPCELFALHFEANDPRRLADFWAGVLSWEAAGETGDDVVLLPRDGTRFRLRFTPTTTRKTRQNRVHLELTSDSLQEQQETVARVLRLGGRHIDIGQGTDEGHVVLADPEGNELCVVEPGNDFLAGCGFIGAINCDGTQDVGYFWSEALEWPLVWDQDQETAIQSPYGGTKIAWGGPPLMPQEPGRNRLQLDLVPSGDGDQQAEVDRLLGLGASRSDSARHPTDDVVLLDPDGNRFSVRPAQEVGRPPES